MGVGIGVNIWKLYTIRKDGEQYSNVKAITVNLYTIELSI